MGELYLITPLSSHEIMSMDESTLTVHNYPSKGETISGYFMSGNSPVGYVSEL